MRECVGTASATSSLVNLLKTILGAGLLSMPLAYSTDGTVFGTFVIFIAALTSGFGLSLQAYLMRFLEGEDASFFKLCQLTYPSLSVIFDLAIAIQCFGCAISYLVLIGDLMPTVVKFTIKNFKITRIFWILSSASFCVPLSFMRNLDSLRYASILGLFAIAYMSALVVLTYFFGEPYERGDIVKFPTQIMDVFSTFSIIVFAFTGHQNMFSIMNEAKDKRFKSNMKLILGAVGISSLLFICVGLSGYMTFGNNVSGNVIMGYKNSYLTLFGRFSIVFMVIFSFPLMIHPARSSVINIVNSFLDSKYHKMYRKRKLLETDSLLRPNDEAEEEPNGRFDITDDMKFAFITTILLLTGYLIAIFATSFAKVLAIIGATGSTSISFILPGMFGFKLSGTDKSITIHASRMLRNLSLALVIWGILVMILCLYMAIMY